MKFKLLACFLLSCSVIFAQDNLIDHNLFDNHISADIDYNKISNIVDNVLSENMRPAFDTPSTGEIYKAITNDLVYIVVTNALINQATSESRYTELYNYVNSITNNLDFIINYIEGNIPEELNPLFEINLNFEIPSIYFTTNIFGEYEIHATDEIFTQTYDFTGFEVKAITNNVELYHASLTNRVGGSLLVSRLYPLQAGIDAEWIIYNDSVDFSHSDEVPINIRFMIDKFKLSDNEWCNESNTDLIWYFQRLPRVNGISNWIQVKPKDWNSLMYLDSN